MNDVQMAVYSYVYSNPSGVRYIDIVNYAVARTGTDRKDVLETVTTMIYGVSPCIEEVYNKGEGGWRYLPRR